MKIGLLMTALDRWSHNAANKCFRKLLLELSETLVCSIKWPPVFYRSITAFIGWSLKRGNDVSLSII